MSLIRSLNEVHLSLTVCCGVVKEKIMPSCAAWDETGLKNLEWVKNIAFKDGVVVV